MGMFPHFVTDRNSRNHAPDSPVYADGRSFAGESVSTNVLRRFDTDLCRHGLGGDSCQLRGLRSRSEAVQDRVPETVPHKSWVAQSNTEGQ